MPEGVSLSKGPIKVDLGTSWGLIDPITRQVVGQLPKDTEYEAANKARGAATGKAQGESAALYRSMTSKMPGLEEVVGKLDKLAETATYTLAGRGLDEVMRQTGMTPRTAAVDRSEYVATVDNQILPLLRDTFGAQFTQKEGETLRATLGDPNKSPVEKQSLLRAFIEQKRRDIEALALQTMQDAGTTSRQGNDGGVVDFNDYFR